jgi:regulator of replication initiation timing
MQQSLSHTIYQKLQKLVKEYEQLKKENQKLRRELDEQLAANKDSDNKVELLESQVALLKSNAGQIDAAARKEMERRIQQYIKDIDTAIKLLNE